MHECGKSKAEGLLREIEAHNTANYRSNLQ